MSRIGRKPISVPAGVEVNISKNNHVVAKGPNGTLEFTMHPEIQIAMEGSTINVIRPTDEKKHRSLHGLTRTLISNMVVGVSDGFKKDLEVNGVGYRVQKTGTQLIMNLGYSHQVIVDEIPGITITVEGTNKITVSGPDKQKVGQFAAEIREKRPPEPYKGKGIKYVGEVIIRKEGKTGSKKK